MDGKWAAVWNYLIGALVADLDTLTDALIAISTAPEKNAARREEIRGALADTLQKKGVEPLTAKILFNELRSEQFGGLHRRAQTALQLMSNTQSLGLVVISDYLHLSRSLFAVIGSFGSVYNEEPRLRLAQDVLIGLGTLPMTFVQDRLESRFAEAREAIKQRMPAVQTPSMREMTQARLRALTLEPVVDPA